MIFAPEFLARAPIMRQQVAALFRHEGGDMTPLRSIPTLIVTGTQDVVIRTRFSDDLLSHLPQARIERFTDAGHGVPVQHAAAVNKLLREHIARAG
jgi:pimeloyl-ACP methyl ester carboxylesterase